MLDHSGSRGRVGGKECLDAEPGNGKGVYTSEWERSVFIEHGIKSSEVLYSSPGKPVNVEHHPHLSSDHSVSIHAFSCTPSTVYNQLHIYIVV